VASGTRAVWASAAFTALASAGLWTALLTSDFSLRYVASYTSANLPTVYKISAFWGGQSGSLLFWCLVLAGFAALTTWRHRVRHAGFQPWVAGTLGLVLTFFLAATAIGANPFERLDWVPPDGNGLNPQLQHPAMAIHPPMLYLGYVGTVVPFAFAIGALITRRLDATWLGAVRFWALVSWFFLTIGLVLGMWWAYEELGWGGYWAWDPVENAPLLSWLTGTAFLHSIMIQEKRGMLRKWNVVLVMLTFLLSILGTFITRSGVIQSVHAFAQSEVGDWFAWFLGATTVASVVLLVTRLRDLEPVQPLESMVSREAAFLYNNLVLVGIAFSVLWGTLFPILSEAVRGTRITVGPPFFNTVNAPLGLLLLALTGVGPLIAWRRASPENLRRQFAFPVGLGLATGALLVALGFRAPYPLVAFTLAGFVSGTILQEFQKGLVARHRIHAEPWVVAFPRLIARNRRRYGGYIVHAGIVMLFVAFAGNAFRIEHDVALKAGESFTARDPYGAEWTFTNQGTSQFAALNRQVLAVALKPVRDGVPMPVITSEKRQHVIGRPADPSAPPSFQPSTEAGILESARQDVYVVFSGMRDAETADLRIAFNPLVLWVWIGGLVMALGGVIVMWPPAERTRPQPGYAAPLTRADGAPAGVA
jgi:cytochrome c-type biogenesis protein CcmF